MVEIARKRSIVSYKRKMHADIAVAMGGRIAEEQFLVTIKLLQGIIRHRYGN